MFSLYHIQGLRTPTEMMPNVHMELLPMLSLGLLVTCTSCEAAKPDNRHIYMGAPHLMLICFLRT